MSNHTSTKLRRACVAFAVAALLGVGALGCGGGNSSGATTDAREAQTQAEGTLEGSEQSIEEVREEARQSIEEARRSADTAIEEAKSHAGKAELEEVKESTKESLEMAKEEARREIEEAKERAEELKPMRAGSNRSIPVAP